MADIKGIRPIYLITTFSESLKRRLLKLGADPTVLTTEGQTPLMIAYRTRQSNLIGLLVDFYTEHGGFAFVDRADFKGRSALHYAFRSGRHESVKILLSAGAKPNLKDKERLTPLHACAEFFREDGHWTNPETATKDYGEEDAGYILLSNTTRRSTGERNSDPVGVHEPIRLLVAYGADISLLNTINRIASNHYARVGLLSNQLDTAIEANSEAMVDELLSIEKLNTSTQSTASS